MIDSYHKKIKFYAFCFVISFLVFGYVYTARAEDFVLIEPLAYPLSENTVFSSPQEEVSLSFSAGCLTKPAIVKIMQLAPADNISAFFSLPDGAATSSDLYFVRFSSGVDAFSSLPTVSIHYQKNDRFQEIYWYNWAELKFEKLPSTRDELNQTISFEAPNRDSFMFAVFGENKISGLASWYTHPNYIGTYIAASRDFAINSKVKVVNTDNGKETVVTIKDYGPKRCADWTEEEQEKMGPCRERIIDLSKTAFAALSPVSAGVINVSVEPSIQTN